MTEQEWLASTDLDAMLSHVHGQTSDRKLRLFACACCYQIWDLLTDERSQNAVKIAERFADGEATDEERAAARDAARDAAWDAARDAAWDAARAAARDAAWDAAWAAAWDAAWDAARDAAWAAAWDAARAAAWAAAWAAQASLLRDIFGNPFRPSPLYLVEILAWDRGIVSTLARGIYEQRSFERMPILADALEEAGCTNADILSHCRADGPHGRGCWVVDLLLGKK